MLRLFRLCTRMSDWLKSENKGMKNLLLLGILTIVSGCGSVGKVTYYAPEARANIEIQASFRGPKEVVKVKVTEDLEMNVIIFEQPKRSINLFFNLPEGNTIKFLDEGFKLKSINKEVSANIVKIQANYIVDGVGSFKYFKVSDILVGNSQNIKTSYGKKEKIHRPFSIDIKLNEKPPEEFKLYFPKFLLTGEPVDIEPIRYMKMSGEFYQVSTP